MSNSEENDDFDEDYDEGGDYGEEGEEEDGEDYVEGENEDEGEYEDQNDEDFDENDQNYDEEMDDEYGENDEGYNDDDGEGYDEENDDAERNDDDEAYDEDEEEQQLDDEEEGLGKGRSRSRPRKDEDDDEDEKDPDEEAEDEEEEGDERPTDTIRKNKRERESKEKDEAVKPGKKRWAPPTIPMRIDDTKALSLKSRISKKSKKSKTSKGNGDTTTSGSSNSNSSGSNGSFEISKEHKRPMQVLQSAVRDHELPLRIAYEQLDELAANAEKVKSAIKKNRSMLNIQVKKSNSRYLRAAFAAWKLKLDWGKTKKRDMARARAWSKKHMMQRVFRAWLRLQNSRAKMKRLLKSASQITKRRNLRRCWKAWLAMTMDKIREQDDHKKEKRMVKDLDSKYQERICRRACNTLYRWRLRRLFRAFRDGCNISKLQDMWESALHKNLEKKKLKRLFEAWKNLIQDSKDLESAIQTKNQKKSLRGALQKWQQFMYEEHPEHEGERGGEDRSQDGGVSSSLTGSVFDGWAGVLKDKKQDVENMKLASDFANGHMLKNGFVAMVDGCADCRRKEDREKRALGRMRRWNLNKSFQAWINFMQMEAQKKMERMQEHVVRVEKENDRLREENQRLAHVIDSGNWGKERISELVQAGQVLTGERDALTRLLGRMQRQHTYALDQQKQHQEEVRDLKRQLLGKQHLMRNKMLVKGASSYNSLIKAMKDDVLKNGNNPELLYTIDKLAMEEVTVFPDGDLLVKNMQNFERGKGNWSSRYSSPTSANQGLLTNSQQQNFGTNNNNNGDANRQQSPPPSMPIPNRFSTPKRVYHVASNRASTPLTKTPRSASSNNNSTSTTDQAQPSPHQSTSLSLPLRSIANNNNLESPRPMSRPLSNLTSASNLTSPRPGARSKTPLRGRPSDLFDYNHNAKANELQQQQQLLRSPRNGANNGAGLRGWNSRDLGMSRSKFPSIYQSAVDNTSLPKNE